MVGDEPVNARLAYQLADLETTDPQRYTLLEKHLPVLRTLIEESPRNYPSAKQLYQTAENTSLQPQTIGQALVTLAELEIVGVHTQRSNRNRYDLTGYDPERVKELEALLKQK